MNRRTLVAGALGLLVGAAMGLVAFAFAAARTIDHGLVLGQSGASFVVGRGSMTIFIMLAGAAVGAVLGTLGYGVGRLADPGERRYGIGIITALAAGTGALVAFGASRAAIGASATSILDSTVTITAFRAALVAVITGAVTGLLVATSMERMARPMLYGFGGEAWPASRGEFVRDAISAIGFPVVSVGVTAAIVIGFSQFLLGVSHTTALIGFSAAAGVILFGASVIAGREPRRRSD